MLNTLMQLQFKFKSLFHLLWSSEWNEWSDVKSSQVKGKGKYGIHDSSEGGKSSQPIGFFTLKLGMSDLSS